MNPGALAPYKEREMNPQVFTSTNPEYGLAVTVTQVSKGYAVTFIDSDSDNIIEMRIYKDQQSAVAYAEKLIAQ